ncbi:MAG: glycogen/starch synthase [Chthoniobacterales bacterium]
MMTEGGGSVKTLGMNIFMAAGEMAPFARNGALADAMLSLAEELQRLGHQVSVAIPYYRCIRENKNLKVKKKSVKITVLMGNQTRTAEVFESRSPDGVQVLLIARDEYFDRTGIYGGDGGSYQDNAERFIFFTKCVLELAQRLDPAPDILHVHDWQTALLPLFVKAQQIAFPTVLTIHSLEFQGNFWSYDFALTNLGAEWFSMNGAEFYGSMNCLKAGVKQADAVIVSSEYYAHEIQTTEFGCGLDAVFRENAWKLQGIPSGVDDATRNPATDKLLAATFTAKNTKGKVACRDAILKKLDLAPTPKGPVFALISDVIQSKSLDRLLPILDRFLANDVRLILIGRVDDRYLLSIKTYLRKHHGKLAWRESDDETHALIAGADAILFPSQVNPEIAISSLRYGTIPVARAFGGLEQIVTPYNEAGNGFVFYDDAPEALLDILRYSLQIFSDTVQWKLLMQRAMQADFSWSASAKRHEQVYKKFVKTSAK